MKTKTNHVQVGEQQTCQSTEQVAQQPPENRTYTAQNCDGAVPTTRMPAAATSADIWGLGIAFWVLLTLRDVQGDEATAVRSRSCPRRCVHSLVTCYNTSRAAGMTCAATAASAQCSSVLNRFIIHNQLTAQLFRASPFAVQSAAAACLRHFGLPSAFCCLLSVRGGKALLCWTSPNTRCSVLDAADVAVAERLRA